MALVKAIMIGDVVGEPGLAVLERLLPPLIQREGADFVVVNGENAAAGFGITEGDMRRILNAGADVISSGNHVWEKREFWPAMDAEPRILRPLNYPPGSPGRGSLLVEKNKVPWLVINLQGRELMTPIDCPFRAFDSIADPPPVVLVDFHGESTREKEALGHYLDGRASVIAGTHTHVQTADERILPRGSAYITDIGMTGVVDAVIGMDTEICLARARTQVLYRMSCAEPSGRQAPEIQGILAEIDGDTGKALSIRRLRVAG
ncbi:MAG: YmdB family metallophosphoesterase [Treponema sp.]|jgi:metallophosphoesterase (TIGR00282 family)|nr:YmdB family metallophosphoesterase [Treponema sp.]